MTDNPQNRSFTLPEDFPTPCFKFGDWVETTDGDVGRIVGMSLYKSDALGQYWMYNLDLRTDSPGYELYQGGFEESPCCFSFGEWDLKKSKEQ